MPLTVQDQILSFLRMTGPVLPSKLAKNLKSDQLIAAAHLSDLASQGKVKISSLKVGGSPLYYLPGQEAQLYPFAAGNINPKDNQVLERLKEKTVLRESALDLLSKVALRSLQDFAIPLQVTVEGKRELFWKWHLLPEPEMNASIRRLLFPETQEPLAVPLSVPQPPVAEQVVREEPVPASSPAVMPSSIVSPLRPGPALLPLSSLPAEPPLAVPESSVPQHPERQMMLKEKKPLLRKLKETLVPKRTPVSDDFFPIVEQFFRKLHIAISEKEMIRKGAEMNFFVRVSSVVGETTYFCKAKNKKRCDEKDLSAAYMEAQIKKLPLLFLYTGELHPKAREMLESDAFKNAIVKKIE